MNSRKYWRMKHYATRFLQGVGGGRVVVGEGTAQNEDMSRTYVEYLVVLGLTK